MGALAFFPWLRLASKPHKFGEFVLLPHVRGDDSPGASVVDAVTAPYQEGTDQPIREVTLVAIDGRDLLADIDDDQVNAAFVFGEMVALAGLAKRQVFAHTGYSNRDTYRLVIQRFDQPGGGSLQLNRRVDGAKRVYVTAAAHQVPCPGHVDLEPVVLDVEMLSALLACRSHADADVFVESMMGFNLANTDSSEMSPHLELVLLVGALQRILCCNSKDDDLAAKFSAALAPRKDHGRGDCSRLVARPEKFAKSPTVRDAWVRDLYAVRHPFAHGKLQPRTRSIWTIPEHRLLAGFAFPLVMKQQLAKAGLYTTSEDDRLAIDAFESLVCSSDLFQPIDRDRGLWPWNEIVRRITDDALKARAVARLERQDGTSGGAG